MLKLVAKYDPNHGPRLNSVEITSAEQLRHLLDSLPEREDDPCVMLENSRRDWLLIGVRDQVGFVVFHPGKGNRAPTMSASTRKKPVDTRVAEEYFEFLVGGVATPIPTDRCLPMEKVISVAVFFYETGKLPKSVTWAVDCP